MSFARPSSISTHLFTKLPAAVFGYGEFRKCRESSLSLFPIVFTLRGRISQVADQGWDLYLFPSDFASPHTSLRNLTLFGADPLRPANLDKSVRYKRWTSYYFYRDVVEKRLMHHSTMLKEIALARVIRRY